MKNVMSMSKYLKSLFAHVALCCLCACGDAPDCTNPEANMSVAINADGTASNGAVYSQIDATRFMLDFVKYEVDGSHLKIIGYDNDNLPEVPKLYALVSIDGTKYKTRIIRYAAFAGARITSLVLPETVTDIGLNAFSDCYYLQELYIPDGVRVLGQGVFRRCTSLMSIDLPKALTMIPDYSFYACHSLREVHLPKTVTTIGSYAFGDCKSLRSVDFSGGLTAIGEYAFRNCALLQNVDFPKSLTAIGEYAFLGCGSLNNVAFSNSLKDIRKGAFCACVALVCVDFPETLASIGSEAFGECKNLKTVKFLCLLPPELDCDTFSSYPKAYVKQEALQTYKDTDVYSKLFSEILPME